MVALGLVINGGTRPVAAQTSTAAVSLSLRDAVNRALTANLSVLLSAQNIRTSRAQWLSAIGRLLPDVTVRVTKAREQASTAELGFTPGTIPGFAPPAVIGPFDYVAARAYLSQTVFNWSDVSRLRSAAAERTASEHSYHATRDLVVQATINAYLLVVSDGALIDATRAQLETARAVLQQARERNAAGVVAAIDVLRARVQLQTEEQALIAADNQLAIDKLTLGRVIGLPADQDFILSDGLPYSERATPTVDQALSRAYQSRADYHSSQAQLRAAELSRQAAVAQHYPSAAVTVSYGAVGTTFAESNAITSVAATVSIPVFQGTTVRGQVLQADAAVQLARERLADLGQQIDFEVRRALLDIGSASAQVAVAGSTVAVAEQTLEQARDRFAAGIADTLEVVQAQAAVAAAHRSYIDRLYGYNSATVLLAQAIGVAEESGLAFLGAR